MAEASPDSRFRRAASFVPSGVAVLHAADARMTVSTLQCVSFDPPWVSVAQSGRHTGSRQLHGTRVAPRRGRSGAWQ